MLVREEDRAAGETFNVRKSLSGVYEIQMKTNVQASCLVNPVFLQSHWQNVSLYDSKSNKNKNAPQDTSSFYLRLTQEH